MSARIMDRPEEDWHGAGVGKLQELRERALEAGCSEATANGLVGWIVSGDAETAASDTRARYRKVLRELGPPATSPGPGRRNAHTARARGRGQRGAAELRALAGTAGTLATAALCAAAGRPALALVVAPIIPVMLSSGEAFPWFTLGGMDEPEAPRERQLDVRVSGGLGPKEWHARCRTCGWEIHAVGDYAAAKTATGLHRCPPMETPQPSA